MYMFCENAVKTFVAAWNTIKMMIGGFGTDANSTNPITTSRVPEYMEKACIRFMKNAMNYTMDIRTTNYVDVEDYI